MPKFTHKNVINTEDDPYLWLEEVESKDSLAWATNKNTKVESKLINPRYQEFYDCVLDILDDKTKIPMVSRRGEFLYNFWIDADHERGLWRRIKLESYLKRNFEWEILIDFDEINKAENRNWVYGGAHVLYPNYERALISLSEGGSDACEIREFDLITKKFISETENGFFIPVAKTRVTWVDVDTVYVGTDMGEGSLTDSGYPRTIRLWKRGQKISDSIEIYNCEKTDVSCGISYDHDENRYFISRSMDFYNSKVFQFFPEKKRLVEIPVQSDADIDIHKNWLIIMPKTDWEYNDTTYESGCVLIVDYEKFMNPLTKSVPIKIFEPDQYTSLSGLVWTKNFLVMSLLHNVASKFVILDPSNEFKKTSYKFEDLPEFTSAGIISTNHRVDDEIFLTTSSFTEPSALWYTPSITEPLAKIDSSPSYFDASEIKVTQHWTTSDDGTKIPYFYIGKHSYKPQPVLLYGYGGFEVPLTPSYMAVAGKLWLENGYGYVIANIRGGGEFGPKWHTQTLKENRHLCYEDFSSVVKDLIDKGFTAKEKLAVQGGSNGGLLTGVMYTQYPHLLGAVICQVPLIDMKRFHTLLAGASWMGEYGNPDTSDWDFIQQYSPYHHVDKKIDYPPILVMTSTKDDRVHPGHARKFVARIEEYQPETNLNYFENIDGGHSGAADNKGRAKQVALGYEFLHQVLGNA